MKVELTKDEVIILKNLHERYKYIARDAGRHKVIAVYAEKPVKSVFYDGEYVSKNRKGEWYSLLGFNHLFKDITYESGPHLIANLIK